MVQTALAHAWNKGPNRQNAITVSEAKKNVVETSFISDRAHRTRQRIAAIFTAEFAGMLFLGNFTDYCPRENGSLNISIVFDVTLQHVVKLLFYFVKNKKYHKFLSYP